jgi:hypothetical protein
MFEACVTIHILFWLYVIFGSFLGQDHARFILLWLIPFVWLLHMAPFHILFDYESKMVGLSRATPLRQREEAVAVVVSGIFPFMRPVYDLQFWCQDNCTFNPIGGQGMIILGAIVASRIALKK